MSAKHHQPDHTDPHETPLDSWHQHLPAEGLPREEHGAHANVRVLLGVFTVLVVATLGFSALIGVYTLAYLNAVSIEGEQAGLVVLAAPAQEYKRDALARQGGYGWTEGGKVKLPIERAMAVVVEEHAEARQE